MIAKVPAKRHDGKSSFRTLKQYMTRDEPDRLTGEVKKRDVALETNCLSVKTASAEMKAAAAMNPLVKDPVYHFVISWQKGEQPTDAQMFEAARNAMQAVGMEGHQYLAAVHRDTGNAHVHLMVNRVHPESEKAVYPDRDFYKLDRAMRETEIAQGWKHDKGPYVVENGKVQRRKGDNQMAEKAPTKAKDMEIHSAAESFCTYAQGAKKDVLTAMQRDGATWSDVHQALAKHGLEIRLKGMGLAIHSTTDPNQTPIKASDLAQALGKGKSENRLGEFWPATAEELKAAPASERIYNKHREPHTRERTPEQQAVRDARREARAQARAELKARYETYRVERKAGAATDNAAQRDRAKALLRNISAMERQKRQAIFNADLSKAERQAMRSVAAFEAARDRERVRADLATERKQRRPETYKEWAAKAAAAGDAAALSQVHGWAYNDTRKKAALAKEALEAARLGAIAAAAPAGREPMPPGVLEGLSWLVDKRRGEVSYTKNGTEVFRDRGEQIGMSQAGQADRAAITAALLIARQKFNGKLSITGSDAFKATVIDIAVKERMPIVFIDPAMEAARQKAVYDRDHKRSTVYPPWSKQNAKNFTNLDQFVYRPPPSPADGLHDLSSLRLVHDAVGIEMLLPGHESPDVDDQQTEPDNSVRHRGPGRGGIAPHTQTLIDTREAHAVAKTAEATPEIKPDGVALAGDGFYVGKVLDVNNGYIIQSLGAGKQIAHRIADLGLAKVPAVGDRLEITRKDEKSRALVRSPEQSRGGR